MKCLHVFAPVNSKPYRSVHLSLNLYRRIFYLSACAACAAWLQYYHPPAMLTPLSVVQ